NQLFLFLGKLKPRFVDWKIKFVGVVYQLITIPAHAFATPRKYCIFINGQRCVWNHQIFVNTNNIAISLTSWASAVRIVEAEKMHIGFQKNHTVGFKAVVKFGYFP